MYHGLFFLWKDVLTITAVQSTTKPESIFLNRTDERIPKLGNLIILGHRELIYTFLGKGYVDAVAAHEESIVQYRKDYDASFRILEEPLMITGIGVAFAKGDDRGICEQMEQTLEQMRQDGTSLKIIEKYLDDRRSDWILCGCSLSVLFLPYRESGSRKKNGGDRKLC